MRKLEFGFAILAILLLGVVAGSSVHSADLGGSDQADLRDLGPASPLWHFTFTPYAWAPAIKGDVTARGRSFDVDASINDVLSALNFAAFGYLEARRGRFGLYSDLIYANLGLSGSAVRQTNPVANLSLTVGAQAGLKYKLTIVAGGLFYRVFDNASHSWCARQRPNGA